MNLTAHFKLSESEKSSTASAHHIDNHVPVDSTGSPTSHNVYKNRKNLCEQLLEPLRQHFDCPIVIDSGYRSPQLNTLVGGVKNSQHKTGEAADIHIPVYDFVDANGQHHTNMELLNKWFTWIIDNCDFDPLIKETANRRTYWIQVSCKCDRTKNRHQAISFLLKGGQK